MLTETYSLELWPGLCCPVGFHIKGGPDGRQHQLQGGRTGVQRNPSWVTTYALAEALTGSLTFASDSLCHVFLTVACSPVQGRRAEAAGRADHHRRGGRVRRVRHVRRRARARRRQRHPHHRSGPSELVRYTRCAVATLLFQVRNEMSVHAYLRLTKIVCAGRPALRSVAYSEASPLTSCETPWRSPVASRAVPCISVCTSSL